MAVVERAFFDTSVLLPALIGLKVPATPAERLFNAVVAGRLGRPCTAWHCCLEFLAVATRLPGPARIAVADALFVLQQEVLPRFDLHQLPPTGFGDFLHAAWGEQAAGGRVYDLHIAEVARAAASQVVVTNNRRHFLSLLRHGIRVLTAEEALSELLPTPDG